MCMNVCADLLSCKLMWKCEQLGLYRKKCFPSRKQNRCVCLSIFLVYRNINQAITVRQNWVTDALMWYGRECLHAWKTPKAILKSVIHCSSDVLVFCTGTKESSFPVFCNLLKLFKALNVIQTQHLLRKGTNKRMFEAFFSPVKLESLRILEDPRKGNVWNQWCSHRWSLICAFCTVP